MKLCGQMPNLSTNKWRDAFTISDHGDQELILGCLAEKADVTKPKGLSLKWKIGISVGGVIMCALILFAVISGIK